MTAVLWLTLAVAMITFAALSWLDLTRRPTAPAIPIPVASHSEGEHCPSSNGQLRSCDDDEREFTRQE